MWKVNGRWTPSDVKSSHCVWQGEVIKMWYKIYFIGKFKIMLIVNRNIFFMFLITTLEACTKEIFDNRQNKTIKKLKINILRLPRSCKGFDYWRHNTGFVKLLSIHATNHLYHALLINMLNNPTLHVRSLNPFNLEKHGINIIYPKIQTGKALGKKSITSLHIRV